jgi:hypothetical protein
MRPVNICANTTDGGLDRMTVQIAHSDAAARLRRGGRAPEHIALARLGRSQECQRLIDDGRQPWLDGRSHRGEIAGPWHADTDHCRAAIVRTDHRLDVRHAACGRSRCVLGEHVTGAPGRRQSVAAAHIEEMIVAALPGELPVAHRPGVDEPAVQRGVRQRIGDRRTIRARTRRCD